MSDEKPIIFIPLTQGKVAVIDFDDFEKIRGTEWYAIRNRRAWYAARKINGRQVKLHSFLMEPPADKQIDHENGDGLDNRRDNLQTVSDAGNKRSYRRKKIGSSSMFRGVHWHKLMKKWRAEINFDGAKHCLGFFESETDAAKAYNTKAVEFGFSEGAINKFPREFPGITTTKTTQ